VTAAALGLAAVLLLLGSGRASARVRDLARRGRLRTPRPGPLRAVRHRWIGPAAALAGGALWVRVGAALTVAAAVAVGVAALLRRDRRRQRIASSERAAVAEAVHQMTADLAAGATVAGAVRAAASADRARRGAYEAAAGAVIRADDPGPLLAATGQPPLRALGHALRVAAVTGAPPAAVLERVADDLAQGEERRRAVTAALSGPRASAVLLAGLPVVGLGLGAAMGADPLGFLLGTPAGRGTCCAGVVLDALGLLWVRRIVRRAGGG
jgi:tight adherence protein B